MILCECGCGIEVTKEGNRFLHGHNKGNFGKKASSEKIKRMSDSHKGISWSDSRRASCETTPYKHTSEELVKMSNTHMGHDVSDKTRKKISDSQIGRIFSEEHCEKISGNHADVSGENNPAWLGGISFGEYCPKFNIQIKEQIRNEYNYCDYISGIPSYICNPHRKLDVHHVDYNKQQGCNEHKWRLIPLSQSNHIKTNQNRPFWNRLFTYSLEYDEIYYNDRQINIMEMI